MDVQDEVWDLLENLKAHGPRENRLGWALRLGDLMRHPYEVTFVSDVLEHVVELILPMESDVEVRNEPFDAVSRALSANLSVDVSLDPLLPYLSDDDPALIAATLILIGRSGDRRYLPIVERYRTHAHRIIRDNATSAWERGYKRFAGEGG